MLIKQFKLQFIFQTFLALLDGGWWTGHLHGQAIGAAEGVAIPNDKGPGLTVLQQVDG